MQTPKHVHATIDPRHTSATHLCLPGGPHSPVTLASPRDERWGGEGSEGSRKFMCFKRTIFLLSDTTKIVLNNLKYCNALTCLS